MIKITIELLRHGNPDDRELLGTMHIANNSTGTETRGNYRYKAFKKSARLWKNGQIRDFPRQSRSAWRLLYLILKDIYE